MAFLEITQMIQLIFLFPWTFVYREFLAQHLPVLFPILFFLGLLALGLFYELRKGALDWEK
jgi:NADH-quinone oxidoreductase subunit A